MSLLPAPQVLPPSVYSGLVSHLAWVKEEMSHWVTEEQRGRGLHPDYLYSAITGNWQRKRPVTGNTTYLYYTSITPLLYLYTSRL